LGDEFAARARGALCPKAPRLRLAGHCALRRAGGYFLCFAKESNQRKASLRRRSLRDCPALLAEAGGERGLKRSFAECPRLACAARRLRRHATSTDHPLPGPPPQAGEGIKPESAGQSTCRPLPGRGEGRGEGRVLAVDALEDAEQRRVGGGIRRKRALARFRRLPDRAAQGTGEAGGFVGSPSFGYFSWRDKKSNHPRGGERNALIRQDANRAAVASAAATIPC